MPRTTLVTKEEKALHGRRLQIILDAIDAYKKKVNIKSLSQKEIAKLTGISLVTVQRHFDKNNDYLIDPKCLVKYAKAFSIDMAWFYDDSLSEQQGDPNMCAVMIDRQYLSLVTRTIDVLKSGTEWASALESNINAFYRSVKDYQDWHTDIEQILKRLEALEGERGAGVRPVSATASPTVLAAMDLHKEAIRDYDHDFMIQQIAGKVPTPQSEVKKRK